MADFLRFKETSRHIRKRHLVILHRAKTVRLVLRSNTRTPHLCRVKNRNTDTCKGTQTLANLNCPEHEQDEDKPGSLTRRAYAVVHLREDESVGDACRKPSAI